VPFHTDIIGQNHTSEKTSEISDVTMTERIKSMPLTVMNIQNFQTEYFLKINYSIMFTIMRYLNILNKRISQKPE
jgi:hypothetical protein